MVGVTVLITLVQPRGFISSLQLLCQSPVLSFGARFLQKPQEVQGRQEGTHRSLSLYLKDKAIELNKLEREQRDGMLYHFPNINELTGLVTDYSHRIYEKTPLHLTFLLSLGTWPGANLL